MSTTEETLVAETHPDCAGCCAVGRCHWCLNKPGASLIVQRGHGGYAYAMCVAHADYFANLKAQPLGHDGVDMRAHLDTLEFPSLLLR